MFSTEIPVYTEWQKVELSTGEEFIYKDIYYRTGTAAVAIGSSEDGQSGYILASSNSGKTWKLADPGMVTIPGMEAMGFQTYSVGLVGGHNGAMYITKSEGRGWQPIDLHPEGNTDEVDTYWCIDFVEEADYMPATYGVIGMELKGGNAAVWYTTDSGDSFHVATGVTGVPQHITHLGYTFYMVTRNGHIQTSTDNGQTWTDLFVTEGNAPLHRIKFADEDNGMALSDGVVYVTADGGKNWTKHEVIAGTPGINPLTTTETIVWNDVVWADGKIIIVGNKGAVYESTDKGVNWTKVTIPGVDETDLYSIAVDGAGNKLNICGAEGSFYLKELKDKMQGYTAGIYDIESASWKLLETLGASSGDVISGPEGISADGKIVIGGSYVTCNNTTQYHACVWSNELGVLDLGSKFADRNKSSKATKMSYDGSVIVGWQDIWGPWYANCERICSLSRYLMADAMNAPMTASAQWLERTLDDSANRRIALPEGFLCADAILRLCQNVASGLRVNETVVDRTLREYLPFMATENLMMEAVKRGGDRQQLHEVIRRHSMAATARMKEGHPCDLLDRLAADPAFGLTRPELEALMDPRRYIGRCPQQVARFLERCQPLLAQAQTADGTITL